MCPVGVAPPTGPSWRPCGPRVFGTQPRRPRPYAAAGKPTHQIDRIEVRALVWRDRCEQFHALRRIAVEADRGTNPGLLYCIPDGSVWNKLRRLRRELLCLGRIATQREGQCRTAPGDVRSGNSRQARRLLRIRTRLSGVSLAALSRRLAVTICATHDVAMEILIGRLQTEADVFRRLACEPSNLCGDGRRIVFNISHFEQALVDSRSIDSARPQGLR
jgi:hypothetical protein